MGARQKIARVLRIATGIYSFVVSYLGLMAVAFTDFNGPRTITGFIAGNLQCLILLASFPLFLIFRRKQLLAVKVQWVLAIVYAVGEWVDQWTANHAAGAHSGLFTALRETLFSPESAYYLSLFLAVLFTALFRLQRVPETSQLNVIE